MASVQPPNDPSNNNDAQKEPEQPAQGGSGAPDGTAVMDTTPDAPAEETWEDIPEEIRSLSTDEVLTRIRLIENDIKVREVSIGIGTRL
jgi:26S proteasome regulatory subunit T5